MIVRWTAVERIENRPNGRPGELQLVGPVLFDAEAGSRCRLQRFAVGGRPFTRSAGHRSRSRRVVHDVGSKNCLQSPAGAMRCGSLRLNAG